MDEYEQATDAKLLLVDDRVENLLALEAVLRPLGHTLVRATSGQEALRQVLLHDFAVILLDVQMPEMSGFETAKLIKSRERSRSTPIIFLTAISKDEEYVFEGYSTGAVDYMFKPLNPDILCSKVAVFVDLYLKNVQLRRQSEMLRESERRELELQHRARLLESEARFAHIVDSATDAIITCGDDRKVTLFNTAAQQIFGYRASEALGKSIGEFFDEHLGPELALAPAGGRGQGTQGASRQPVTQEAMGVRKSGERIPVELSVSSLTFQDERVNTLILRDISERRRAEEMLRSQATSLAQSAEELRVLNDELNKRTIELERALTARSRFYASMSHELRTPINAILGYSSLLLDQIYGPLNEQQANSIERTHTAANHLLELVNDILDLSKIEAGKMELQLEGVGFPRLIEDLFVTVRPFATQHGVDVSLGTCEEAFTIISDARRVRQIVLNLLSNAIKFGGGKPVEVVCSRTDNGGVLLEVIDHGPGIPVEDQERIFDEFVQLSEDPEYEGTGLGLPISRQLAELLGGSLTVTSRPGEGSTFRLYLPDSDPELMQTMEG